MSEVGVITPAIPGAKTSKVEKPKIPLDKADENVNKAQLLKKGEADYKTEGGIENARNSLAKIKAKTGEVKDKIKEEITPIQAKALELTADWAQKVNYLKSHLTPESAVPYAIGLLGLLPYAVSAVYPDIQQNLSPEIFSLFSSLGLRLAGASVGAQAAEMVGPISRITEKLAENRTINKNIKIIKEVRGRDSEYAVKDFTKEELEKLHNQIRTQIDNERQKGKVGLGQKAVILAEKIVGGTLGVMGVDKVLETGQAEVSSNPLLASTISIADDFIPPVIIMGIKKLLRRDKKNIPSPSLKQDVSPLNAPKVSQLTQPVPQK